MQHRNETEESSGPILEGFTIQTGEPGREQRVREIVADILGPGWQINPFGEGETDFEIAGNPDAFSAEEAWQTTYRLRMQRDVIYAEPVFSVSISGPPVESEAPHPQERGDAPAHPENFRERSVLAGSPPLPESEPKDWTFRRMKIYEAWEKFFPAASGKLPGQGIVIGHPDTGYRRHPEIIANVLTEMGWDFVGEDDDSLDELDEGLLHFPGHGTSTASVIISPKEASPGYEERNVLGIAPGAKLIPFRVSPSVIHISMFNVAHAIEYATDKGAHVISMSLGGLFSYRLRKAVTYAQKRGVIVVSAAGNNVRFVVWPAAYEEVIAVAACNARTLPWRGSSRGRSVDVTAPGESVWVARVEGGEYPVRQGSGTSFAAAAVAGIAALWLSHHGRDRLIERYGAEKIPFIFNQILRETCDPVDWSEGNFGAGIVNAKNVLAAELPDGVARSLAPPAFALQDHTPLDNGGIETFYHLFEQSLPAESTRSLAGKEMTSSTGLGSTLAELLHTSVEQLPAKLKEVGQELAFHLAVDPQLYDEFEKALSPASERRSRPREGFTAATPSMDLEQVRGTLLKRGVSDALKTSLNKG